jgi:hypothetical protein
MMEGSESKLKRTSQHESQLSKPDLEHRFELQLSTTQSRPPHDLESKHDGGECICPEEEVNTNLNCPNLILSIDLSSSSHQHSQDLHMTSIASTMEGSQCLKTIVSKHKLIENTNIILSVKNNSLSQELFHSLEIASFTDSEKLCLQRSQHHLSKKNKMVDGFV